MLFYFYLFINFYFVFSDGKFLHGQNLAHPLSKGSLDMTGRRGRRNLYSLRRHRPLLRPVRARRGEPGSGRSLPPRAAGAGQVLPGNRSLSPPPLALTPPIPAPPRHDGDAASPAPGRILAAMVSPFLRSLPKPSPRGGSAPVPPPGSAPFGRIPEMPKRRYCSRRGKKKPPACLRVTLIYRLFPHLPQVLGILLLGEIACRLFAFILRTAGSEDGSAKWV